MVERWLFCEGITDTPVLSAVFSALSVDIIPESTGGSPGEVARWRREQGAIAVSVSDRDYRELSECDATFVAGSQKFVWRRHSIESYLLEPEVVAMAMANMKSSLLELEHPPACAAGLPTEVDQIKAELIEAAREISPQECGCIVIETMWRELTESLGRIQKRVPAILANGNLPSEKDCQDALVNEFNRIRDAASRCSSAEELTDSSIRKRFDAKLSMVTDANFLNELRFIPAFHGKRLMRRLRNRLQSGFGFSPNQKLFQRELTNSLESLVLENPESDVANDFRDLANIVCALIPG